MNELKLSIEKKQKLIEKINWDLCWNELDYDQQSDFLQLHGIQFMTSGNKSIIEDMYRMDKMIVSERGENNLINYI